MARNTELDVYAEPDEQSVREYLSRLTLLGRTIHGSDVRAGAILPRVAASSAELALRRRWDYFSPGMVGALLVARVTERGEQIDAVSSLHIPGSCMSRCVTVSPYHSREPALPRLSGRPILNLFTDDITPPHGLPELAYGSEIADCEPEVLRLAFAGLRDTGHTLLPLNYEFDLPAIHPEISAS